MERIARRCGFHAIALSACTLLSLAWPQASLATGTPPPGFEAYQPGDVFPIRVPDADVGGQGEGNHALHDAIGAAVLAVLPALLGGATVTDLSLQSMETTLLGGSRWRVAGEGSSNIPGHGQVGFGYSAVFDTSDRSLSRPLLTLGGIAPGERARPNDPAIVGSLENAILQRLAEDLGEPAARLRLDRIETVEVGSSMLRISAVGLADFGPGGTTAAEISGLYELNGGRWQSVDFQLSSGDGWQPGQAALPPDSVAMRAPAAGANLPAKARLHQRAVRLP